MAWGNMGRTGGIGLLFGTVISILRFECNKLKNISAGTFRSETETGQSLGSTVSDLLLMVVLQSNWKFVLMSSRICVFFRL